MEPFTLPLSNKGTVTGICYIPKYPVSAQPYYPLIVGLHGGTYRSDYFDANEKHTAAIASKAFGVPFVSIDRPCYGGTDSLLPIPEDSSFDKETGVWLHQYIFPALWRHFGVPNACTCIVALSHSLGVMGGIIATALHAQDAEVSYPVGGLIMSGLGTRHLTLSREGPGADDSQMPKEVVTTYPPEVKDALMFRQGTVDPDILALTEKLHSPAPLAEIQSLQPWLSTWEHRWAPHITVPVMFALSEQDSFFEGTKDHVEACARAFRSSSRIDASLVTGAPHCLELSYWSQGWYARCFGFALECATEFAIKSQSKN
ncbi:hypothetical protein M426DRAFT_21639 [Hypoxylon sp. CI-4A]|nr:hypothetical protein M426DRAFT_21639 [Hypoxylon sp. CI-4A]